MRRHRTIYALHMPAPFERRALTFEGKPVILYVAAPPRTAASFVARCHGATLAAQDERLTEDEYVARIQENAAGMGLVAVVQRRDDREIVFDVRVAPKP